MNTVTVDINASPERVFLWIDDPERARQWIPNLVGDEIIEETENKIGSTWRQVYEENGRRMEMFCTCTAREPNRRLSLEAKGELFDLSIDYWLEDLDDHTRLTQFSTVKMKGFFKIMGLLIGPFMKKAQTKQQHECFEKLKQLVENE